MRWVGKIVRPGSLVETRTTISHGEPPRRVVRDRRLVAVVAVRDQQLPVARRPRRSRRSRDPPELRALDLEVGLALRARRPAAGLRRGGRSARAARRPPRTQPQPPFLRLAVRPLVREDDAGLVRLGLERRDEARARARDAVGADVVLLERPEASAPPRAGRPRRARRAKSRRGLLLGVGQREVDDVVRALRAVRVPLGSAR